MEQRFFDVLPQNRKKIVIVTPRGLGDTIYLRPFVRDLAKTNSFELYINTPWPELYEDIPGLTFVPCQTYLRTQMKNVKRYPPSFFKNAPEGCAIMNVYYNKDDLFFGSILSRFSQQFGGMKPDGWDLPKFQFDKKIYENKLLFKQKIAIVRPVTVRREWLNISRNPKVEYVNTAISILQDKGYFVISVCDLDENNEWMVGEENVQPDLKFHHGELNSLELLGLIQNSNCVVGGVGFLVPAALAAKVPMLVIAGGQAMHNGPDKVADPDFIDGSNLTWAIPDKYCDCDDMLHAACDKTISNFDGKVQSWIKSLT